MRISDWSSDVCSSDLAYVLVVAGLLLGMGTLGDRLGHKRLFVVGLLVFGLASLCAAFSTTPALLIASRALLAVGAAMMMPATLSILRLVFTDDSERAKIGRASCRERVCQYV